MLKLQSINGYMILFDEKDNNIFRSEKLPKSGCTIIAETKLRVWAKKNCLEVR